MGQVLLVTANATTAIPALTASTLWGVGNSSQVGATLFSAGQEGGIWCGVGLVKLLRCTVTANATTVVPATVKVQITGGTQNSSISIAVGTTGTFSDTTHTDQVGVTFATDSLNGYVITNTDAGSITLQNISIVFVPVSGTQTQMTSGGVKSSFSTASSTTYFRVAGASGTNATENIVQSGPYVTGTFKRLFVEVTANARVNATSFGSRLGGVNGNLAISITATTTGQFTDTTNSDAMTPATLIDFFLTTGTGTQTITVSAVGVAFVTTDNTSFAAATQNTIFSTGITRYSPLAGPIVNTVTTESQVQNLASIPFYLGIISVYVIANTASGAGTVNWRKNSVDGPNTVSIVASTTGIFISNNSSDSIVATDLINYKIVSGTGGNTTLGSIATKMFNLPAGNNGLMTMGAGT